MYQEGDNVSQTNTTRKNARQQHPPQTKLPSQHSSTLQIPNPTNHSRPFHPLDSEHSNRSTLPIRAKPTKIRLSRSIGRVIRLLEGDFAQTGRVIMSREGDNVRQTDANRKNARQQHPPQTKTPSQNSSTLQVPNPTDNSRPFHPLDSEHSNRSTLHRQNHPPNPSKTDENQALPVNREGVSVIGG